MLFSVVVALCMLAIFGSLYLQRRHFDAVMKRIENLERAGYVVKMTGTAKEPNPDQALPSQMTMGQKRHLLERASSKRALDRAKKKANQ